MKNITFIFSLVFLSPLLSAEFDESQSVWGIVSAVATILALFFAAMWFYTKKRLTGTEKRLEEKEEKILWFRQLTAQKEQAKINQEHETEKKILQLNHMIEGLERKLKEGTKNQVVAKIEAQQKKRENALSRAGLTQ